MTRMSKFSTYANSKSRKLFEQIIKTEDLRITVAERDNALGDTMIEAKGPTEDIEILKDVYNIVK